MRSFSIHLCGRLSPDPICRGHRSPNRLYITAGRFHIMIGEPASVHRWKIVSVERSRKYRYAGEIDLNREDVRDNQGRRITPEFADAAAENALKRIRDWADTHDFSPEIEDAETVNTDH